MSVSTGVVWRRAGTSGMEGEAELRVGPPQRMLRLFHFAPRLDDVPGLPHFAVQIVASDTVLLRALRLNRRVGLGDDDVRLVGRQVDRLAMHRQVFAALAELFHRDKVPAGRCACTTGWPIFVGLLPAHHLGIGARANQRRDAFLGFLFGGQELMPRAMFDALKIRCR